MAALSGIATTAPVSFTSAPSEADATPPPSQPLALARTTIRSLLTASLSERTLRVTRTCDGAPMDVSPSEVVKLCKGLGSGKLARVEIFADGSAVFDLTNERAQKLVDAAARDEAVMRAGYSIDFPTTLPEAQSKQHQNKPTNPPV
jgi:hypothetical protein